MRKTLAMLLAAVMVLSLAACAAPAESAPAATTEAATQATTQAATQAATEAAKEEPAEIIQVDYYCSIGAYLFTLQDEVTKWNEGEGKEKGVYLNLISNINSYTPDLTALLEAGTHYELIDAGTANPQWVEKGYVQDLSEIEDAELQELIQSYSPYLKKGTNYQQGVLTGLPLEVVPLKFAVNVDLFEKNNLEYPKTWDDVVECAKVITENGKGAGPDGSDVYGFGGTTWSGMFQRLVIQSSLNSVGKTWWDPNTETYDWSAFKKPLECVKEMYENGWILGMDDLAIDPIRARFAEGFVGMFPAPAYDYAVYTSQFPAKCNWTVIDMPTIEPGEAPFKGGYMDRNGCSIDKIAYEKADDAKKAAIVDAFIFLNSDYLNGKIYESGGMIPYKLEVIQNATPNADLGPQWTLFGDIANYTSLPLVPDSLVPLEGDKHETVLSNWCHTPGMPVEEAIEDLNTRYNTAYAILKEDADVDLSSFAYEYNTKK